MDFVLHVGMDPEKPWTNHTVQSKNRSDVLTRTGSRYAPASPCEGLEAIAKSDRACVFIGKPCDASAVMNLRSERPALDEKLGLVLTFFCAGTPSTNGTFSLLRDLEVSTDGVNTIRYRGEGWPGRFKAVYDDGKLEKSYSYEEAWGKLTGYRPLRCNICPDGLGRVADIACGDAWERHEGGDPGRSIVIVRTERGREILHRAMAANYVHLEPAGATHVLAAQQSLLQRRREIFGRLLGMRLLLMPVPKFLNFSLSRSWFRLSFLNKTRTVLGTVRRLFRKRQWKRQPVF